MGIQFEARSCSLSELSQGEGDGTDAEHDAIKSEGALAVAMHFDAVIMHYVCTSISYQPAARTPPTSVHRHIFPEYLNASFDAVRRTIAGIFSFANHICGKKGISLRMFPRVVQQWHKCILSLRDSKRILSYKPYSSILSSESDAHSYSRN